MWPPARWPDNPNILNHPPVGPPLMNTRADTLRSTLDHLALDPRAKDDRKYLVSMLRRLGYTEQQIRDVVSAPSGGDGRIIEIEYRKGRPGPGAFSVVEEEDVETVGFSVTPGRVAITSRDPAVGHGWIALDGDGVVRGPDTDNPWEPHDDWVVEDQDANGSAPVEFTERQVDATAWPEQPDADDAWPEASDDAAWVDGDEADTAWPTPLDAPEEPASDAWVDDASAEAWVDDTSDDAWVDAPEDGPGPAVSQPDAWADVSQDYQVKDAPAGAWEPSQDWSPAADDVQHAEDAVDDIQPFTYGDYRLYTRMVDLSTGRQQRIYFFAKSEPRSGRPSAMPDGYIVEENLRTGLPFLRREASTDVADEDDVKPSAPVHDHCGATTKSGTPCKNAPLEGQAFCNIHKGRA